LISISTFIYLFIEVCFPGGVQTVTFSLVVRPQGSVRSLLHDKIRDAYTHPQFVTDVMKPLQMDSIIDQDVSLSSGKTLDMTVCVCLCVA